MPERPAKIAEKTPDKAVEREPAKALKPKRIEFDLGL